MLLNWAVVMLFIANIRLTKITLSKLELNLRLDTIVAMADHIKVGETTYTMKKLLELQ